MRRTAYTTSDIQWLSRLAEWEGLQSIAAVHAQFTRNEQSSDEWHYYISSQKLSEEELLKHMRKEWSVETMLWCWTYILQKTIAVYRMRMYKEKTGSKRAFSKMMLECLLDPMKLLPILAPFP